MNPALAARAEQMRAEADYRRSVAEFREQRAADQQARIRALLTELVCALAQLPLDADSWPNGRAKANARLLDEETAAWEAGHEDDAEESAA